jgi:uncharacterized protein YjiS (DUF1127 family)
MNLEVIGGIFDRLKQAEHRPRDPIPSKRSVSSLLKRCWGAFQEWRDRERMRAILCKLSDRDLMDIGVTRAEIERAVPISAPLLSAELRAWLR